jgi:hypothetical protein
MTRLEQLRQYRSALVNEARESADHYIKVSGTSPDNCPQLQAHLNNIHQRVRIMNAEIDKLEAINYGRVDAQPHVQFATA